MKSEVQSTKGGYFHERFYSQVAFASNSQRKLG